MLKKERRYIAKTTETLKIKRDGDLDIRLQDVNKKEREKEKRRKEASG